LKAAFNPQCEFYALYWLHFAVKESWVLFDRKTGEQLWVSPEHHPNHHLWKFLVKVGKDEPLEFKIMDLDNQVRDRLALLGAPQNILQNYSDVDLVEAWTLFQ